MYNILRGNVYWINLDKIGEELYEHKQKGRRPCVVISNDLNNTHCSLVELIPLTTKKRNLPTHRKVMLFGKASYLVPENIITVDKSLLLDYYCRLNDAGMKQLNESLKIQLGLK